MCAFLIAVLWGEIRVLNRFTIADIVLRLRLGDFLVGLTIYLKTSIDFAIYIGNLMDKNPGWKSRIAIEIGTAAGNAAGTLAILAVWTFFKEVEWLLVLMIALASLVLLKLAEDSLIHAAGGESLNYPKWFQKASAVFAAVLKRLNALFVPLLRFVIPDIRVRDGVGLKFWPLFGLSFTVPFVLGLDDFAGYVPLFSIVNVFGFAIGVFAGHMILNMLLYLSPAHTIRIVKNPAIAFAGSAAFVGLAVWGLVEVGKLIAH